MSPFHLQVTLPTHQKIWKSWCVNLNGWCGCAGKVPVRCWLCVNIQISSSLFFCNWLKTHFSCNFAPPWAELWEMLLPQLDLTERKFGALGCLYGFNKVLYSAGCLCEHHSTLSPPDLIHSKDRWERRKEWGARGKAGTSSPLTFFQQMEKLDGCSCVASQKDTQTGPSNSVFLVKIWRWKSCECALGIHQVFCLNCLDIEDGPGVHLPGVWEGLKEPLAPLALSMLKTKVINYLSLSSSCSWSDHNLSQMWTITSTSRRLPGSSCGSWGIVEIPPKVPMEDNVEGLTSVNIS